MEKADHRMIRAAIRKWVDDYRHRVKLSDWVEAAEKLDTTGIIYVMPAIRKHLKTGR